MPITCAVGIGVVATRNNLVGKVGGISGSFGLIVGANLHLGDGLGKDRGLGTGSLSDDNGGMGK